MTDVQKRACTYAAKAAGLSLTDHAASIIQWLLAVKTEPEARQWQEGLAFELWKAKRTTEATTMWKKLATGRDDIAARSSRMMKRMAGAAEPTTTASAVGPKK